MILEMHKMQEMIKTVFIAVGMLPENAEKEAEVLVTAEARGVYSHGMQLVPMYLDWFEKGAIHMNPELKVLSETSSSILCDADKGLGGIVFRKAVDRAIEKAKENGMCTLVVKNAGHYGAGAFYVERAAKAGCLSWLYSNTSPAAAPFGGSEKYLGTNPYSFAAPAGRYGNIVLDMATTETAGGKLRAAMNDGKEVPASSGVDRNGKPCTDPAEIMFHGAMSHFGGPKGYGISFMIHAVTGLLSGSDYLKADFLKQEAMLQSFYMNIVDISRFIPEEEYIARAEALIDDIKRVKPAEGFAEVMFPGEIENRKYAKAIREGVYVHDAAYEDFMKAAAARGIELS